MKARSSIQDERRRAAIHVSWNGISEVKDLTAYFQNSPHLEKDLEFLDYLRRELAGQEE